MDDLLERARAARDTAIAPYSDFPVGAALLTATGDVIEGSNFEVVNFSNSLHAEEVALVRALMDGHRGFTALAVAGPDGEGLAPCGRCRQTLVEYCPTDLDVIVDGDGEPVVYSLGELLPAAMTPEALARR